jgi:hypothetical protein
MKSLLRLTLLLATVLALVAATGCGSDTKSSNDYVTALNKVQTDFAASVSKTSAAGSGTQAADVFTNLSTAIDKLIADLKGVEPPDKVKDLHNELISEMTQFKSQVEAAGASLKSGDAQKIVAAQTKFATEASQLGTKIGQTIDGINKKLQG